MWTHLVAANFELGRIPSSILMRWTSMISELSFIDSIGCSDIERHFELEDAMSFMPVHLSIKSYHGPRV